MNVPFRSLLKPTAWLPMFPFPAMMLFLTLTALVLPPWLSMPPTPPLGRLPLIVLVAKEENLLNMPLANWLLLELVLPLMVLLVTLSVADVPFAWGSFKMPPPSLLLTVLPVTLTAPLLLEMPPPPPAAELPVM